MQAQGPDSVGATSRWGAAQAVTREASAGGAIRSKDQRRWGVVGVPGAHRVWHNASGKRTALLRNS